MSQSRESAEATSFAEAMENLELKTPQQGERFAARSSRSRATMPTSRTAAFRGVMETAELEGLDIGDSIEATVVKTGAEIRVSRKMIKGTRSLDQLRGAFESRIPWKAKSPAATRAASK
jgi:hypothetical protein